MTQEDIIELARKAGMHYRRFENEFCEADTDGVPSEMLEAFSKLVAEQEREKILGVLRRKPDQQIYKVLDEIRSMN